MIPQEAQKYFPLKNEKNATDYEDLWILLPKVVKPMYTKDFVNLNHMCNVSGIDCMSDKGRTSIPFEWLTFYRIYIYSMLGLWDYNYWVKLYNILNLLTLFRDKIDKKYWKLALLSWSNVCFSFMCLRMSHKEKSINY